MNRRDDSAPPRVALYAMRTWGELGNLLVARTLKTAIEAAGGFEVQLFEAEDYCPTLRRTGEEIRLLSRRTAADPPAKRAGYLQIIRDLEERFPAEFETAEPPAGAALAESEPLRRHLLEIRPDLAVGTKGIISRLLLTAARRAGGGIPVVNFVSNHGLLELGIHRSRDLPLNLVQFPEARQRLMERYGYDPGRVEVVGPLVAGHELRGFVAPAEQGESGELDLIVPGDVDNPVVVVFCNRGGSAYLEVLRLLGARHPQVPVLFIAYNDPELVEAARALEREARPRRWVLVSRLSQEAYFRTIRQAGDRPAILISKAGPNTVMEALTFGFSPLVLDSGLPMEEWVAGWLVDHGLGLAAPEMSTLTRELDSLLSDRGRLAALKQSVLRFQAESIDPDRTARAIARALRRMLPDGPP
jgi:UDP-N-acetylglucosamine:LPS N-acetylglucosamine transferase